MERESASPNPDPGQGPGDEDAFSDDDSEEVECDVSFISIQRPIVTGILHPQSNWYPKYKTNVILHLRKQTGTFHLCHQTTTG